MQTGKGTGSMMHKNTQAQAVIWLLPGFLRAEDCIFAVRVVG